MTLKLELLCIHVELLSNEESNIRIGQKTFYMICAIMARLHLNLSKGESSWHGHGLSPSMSGGDNCQWVKEWIEKCRRWEWCLEYTRRKLYWKFGSISPRGKCEISLECLVPFEKKRNCKIIIEKQRQTWSSQKGQKKGPLCLLISTTHSYF